MTTRNTSTKETTTTKAKATASKAVAASKKEKPVAATKKEEPQKELPASNLLFKTSVTEYTKEDYSEFTLRHDKIRMSMRDIDGSMESIAFCLYWIYKKGAYKDVYAGVQTFSQYVKKMFGYSKTTAYAFLSIVERFAARDQDGNILEEIGSRYCHYGFSKLSLMVSLTDLQIDELGLSPTMSVRDIKNRIRPIIDNSSPSLPDNSSKENNGKNNDGVDFNVLDKAIALSKKEDNSSKVDSNGEDSGKDSGNDSSVVSSKSGFYSRRLFLIDGFDDYNNKLDKIDDIIHKLYREMPNAKIRIEIDSEEPISEKWGDRLCQ